MLNYEFPPLGGGSANATYYLLKELAKDSSLRIDLVTSSPVGPFQKERFSEQIELFKIPVKKRAPHYWTASELARWSWGAFWFCRNLVKTRNYDLCHCWSGWPSGIVGFSLPRKLPYLVGLRGSDVPGYNLRLRRLDRFVFSWLSPIIWRNAQTVTAVSDHLKELAHRTSKKVPIQVVHNGVDTSHFRPGIKPRRFTILYVGRLIERKGVMDLLKAFRGICAEFEDCKLMIVGEGPDRLKLEEFCHRTAIEPKVSFLGVLDHKELPAIYQRASVFVMPALEEAMSNAMLEAMASGLPLITTDTGAPELIDSNGIVVQKKDHEQMRAAIRRYMVDPGLHGRHSEGSRRLAETMPWSRVAQAYLDVYRQCIKGAKREPRSAA